MREYSVDGRLLLTVKSLHSCSEVCVRIGGVKSQPFTVGNKVDREREFTNKKLFSIFERHNGQILRKNYKISEKLAHHLLNQHKKIIPKTLQNSQNYSEIIPQVLKYLSQILSLCVSQRWKNSFLS